VSHCLRVLITNNTLDQRAGSELYVRDVATALLEQGHQPIAYSTRLGEVADELRRLTVPVVEDLRALGNPPDLIHGQHHVETMTALLHFPGVPAVFFCHGWLPWEEMPPRFPRILRYVAVDELCRQRLVCEHGIAPGRVRLLLNFVDLKRFQPRAALPPRPRRALVFSNYATEDGILRPLRQACASAGLELDVVGLGVGAPCAQPEERLGHYDLVFAKARAALEALAVGTAVVLCDANGLGPLVTAAELDRLRQLNLGLRCLRNPVTADGLLREIGRYDPGDAAQVCQKVRATAGLDAAVDEIVTVYREVLEANAALPPVDREAEGRVAAAYLRSVSPVFQQRSAEPLGRECERLRSEVRSLCQVLGEAQRLRSTHDELERKYRDLEATLEDMQRSALLRARTWLLGLPWLGNGLRRALAGARWVRRRFPPGGGSRRGIGAGRVMRQWSRSLFAPGSRG
jgi:hypothetical protein